MSLRDNVFHPIDGYGDGVSIPQLVVGVLGCLWVPCVAYRAWRSGHARQRDLQDENVRVVLPCFVLLLYVATATTILQSIVNMTVRSSMKDHEWNRAIINAVAWGIHRVPLEGFTFFLMQTGAGERAMRRAVIFGVLFGVTNAVSFVFGFSNLDSWGIYIVAGWNAAMSLGYCVLWLAPSRLLHRRPALIPYAGYWTVLRALLTIAFILEYLSADEIGHALEDTSIILYFATKGVMFNLVTPSILYSAVLADSQFWQGYHDTKRSWFSQLTAPLEGIRFSGSSAAGLADSLDSMSKSSAVKQVNFAALQIEATLLGVGGQARVYKGYYRGQPVAVKVVFCIDLTPDVVQDFCNEAKLLSRMAHPNVVKSYGVCVVPPTVAIVMELCAHGSLGDVLRGDPPMKLTWRAKLLLCRDCVNAIVFLHSNGAVHKDIKGANFLVDGNMTAKLADLGVSEDYLGDGLQSVSTSHLGDRTTSNPLMAVEMTSLSRTGSTAATGGPFRGTLAYGAPEVLDGQPYTPAADVYSLTFVLWEVLSAKLPFDSSLTNCLMPAELTEAICGRGNWRRFRPAGIVDDARTVEGLRPQLPSNTPDAFADLLAAGWAATPAARPRAEQMLAAIDSMIRNLASSEVGDQVHLPYWPPGSGIGEEVIPALGRKSGRSSARGSTASVRGSTRGSVRRPSIITTLNPLSPSTV